MQCTGNFVFHRVQLHPEGPSIYLVPIISLLRRDVNDLLLKLHSFLSPLKTHTIFSVRSRQIWYHIVLTSFIPPYHVKSWSDVRPCSRSIPRKEKKAIKAEMDLQPHYRYWRKGVQSVLVNWNLASAISASRSISCALVVGLWTVTATVSGWSISEMS